MTTPSLVSRTSSFRSLLLGALLVAASASAATDTATVLISGTVASAANITASAGGANLVMDGIGVTVEEHIIKVSDLVVSTNNLAGVTVAATSSGALTNAHDVAVPFTMGVFATDAVPASAAFPSPSLSRPTAATPCYLWIAYSPALVLDPGLYQATITLTLTDNG